MSDRKFVSGIKHRFDKASASRVTLPGQPLYAEDTYMTLFTLPDVRSLYNISNTQDERQLVGIIDKHTNQDVNALTVHDFNFCMYWHRINSYPRSPMQINWRCPHCVNQNNSNLESSSLVINAVDENYEHGLPVPLPSLDEPVLMRLQLVGDDERARRFLREKHKIAAPDAGQVREAVVACLLSPQYQGDLEAAFKTVTRLTPDDMFMVQTFEETFAYGVESYGKFNCRGCGRESSVNFSFSLTNFFPSDNDRRDLRDQILSLKSSRPKPAGAGQAGVRGDLLDGDAQREEAARAGGGAQEARGAEADADDATQPQGAPRPGYVAPPHLSSMTPPPPVSQRPQRSAHNPRANQDRVVEVPLAQVLGERPQPGGDPRRLAE